MIIGGLGSIEGAAIGALIVGLARAAAVHLLPVAELFIDLPRDGAGADVPARGPVPAHPARKI